MCLLHTEQFTILYYLYFPPEGQIILFGTNDGIYYLDLVNLADGTLELVSVFYFLFAFILLSGYKIN